MFVCVVCRRLSIKGECVKKRFLLSQLCSLKLTGSQARSNQCQCYQYTLKINHWRKVWAFDKEELHNFLFNIFFKLFSILASILKFAYLDIIYYVIYFWNIKFFFSVPSPPPPKYLFHTERTMLLAYRCYHVHCQRTTEDVSPTHPIYTQHQHKLVKICTRQDGIPNKLLEKWTFIEIMS